MFSLRCWKIHRMGIQCLESFNCECCCCYYRANCNEWLVGELKSLFKENMKKQKVASRLGSLLFIVIVSGCTQLVQSTPTLSLVEPTIPITMTVATKTATPTLTPSPTSTPIPATPTDIPTLPAEDARQRLLTLLANNNGCRLPCLWGIIPGKSSYLDARSILLPLRGIAATAYFDFTSYPVDDISPLYVESDLRLNTRVAYVYGNDGVVSYIIFRALEEQLSKDEYGNQLTTPIYGSPEFIQRVEYYSLSNLFSEQGIPASVMISRELTYENNRRSFLIDIVILYPNQGIWAQYTTWMDENEVGSRIRSCPVNARIEMELYPPGNPDSFYVLLDKTNWGTTKVGYKTLEEATSMSVQEFYEIFRNPTDQCIETPTNLWPIPEWNH
jgi:hypothetical protein